MNPAGRAPARHTPGNPLLEGQRPVPGGLPHWFSPARAGDGVPENGRGGLRSRSGS
jgi:hypothetical protein